MSDHIDLSSYIDGALTPSETAAADAHLKQCATCRQELTDLKSAIGWIKKTSQSKIPAGLETRILARLKSEKRRISAPWAWSFSGGLVAGLVVAFLVVSPRYRQRRFEYSDLKQASSEQGKYEVDDRRESLSRRKASEHEQMKKDWAAEPAKKPENERLADVSIARDEASEKNLALPVAAKAAFRAGAPAAPLAATMGAGASVGYSSNVLIWKGRTCAVKTFSTRVIRSAAEWTLLWREAFPEAADVPVVDFSSQMVVVVFAGEGRHVAVMMPPPQIENGKLVVRYRRIRSADSARPYSMLAVPVTSAAVEFREAG